MNRIFYALVLVAFAFAAWFQLTWSPPEASEGRAVGVLSDGRAIVVGRSGVATFGGDAWTPLAPPPTVRRLAAVAGLPGGDALVVGGEATARGLVSSLRALIGNEAFDPSAATEIWSSKRGTWSAGPPLLAPVLEPGVVTLPDGDVLLVGGHLEGRALDRVWRFDSEARLWAEGPRMPQARSEAALTLVDGQDVLVVGGLDGEGVAAQDALLLQDGGWRTVPGPRMPRLRHRLVTLDDGSAMLVGGETPNIGPVPTTEVWDPDTWTWHVAGHLDVGRLDPAVVVAGPDVVVAGGTDVKGRVLATAQVFVGATGQWIDVPPLAEARTGAVGVLVKGKAVAVGGSAVGAAVFDADKRTWRTILPTTPMEKLGMGIIDTAGSAVTLALGLIGVMTLFLGLMKVGEAGGLLVILAKVIRPMMVRLFPDVPADHPAMGAMILNMAANALGLGNAATPFGIRAMEELDRLNPRKGTATNAMALFLAINTSNVTILPTGVIALRAATGSTDPGGILVTTLFATICSTAVAIVASKAYQRFAPLGPTDAERVAAGEVIEGYVGPDAEPTEAAPSEGAQAPDPTADLAPPDAHSAAYPGWVSAVVLLALFSLIPLAILPTTRPAIEAAVPWLIPLIVVGLLTFGFFRNVPVYETFVGGARDGFNVATRIIPFLVGILVAIGMFRASGALDVFVALVGPWTSYVGLPGEALPMALLRPLSGSGAYGVLVSIITDPTVGPDTYTGYLVSTFQGSTETTFYVLAVYFGAVGIQRIRHAMLAALTADVAGIAAAVVICQILYG